MTEAAPKTEEPGKGMGGHGAKGGLDMLNGDVKDTLLRLTGPMILGMAAMVAFNLVDTMYVGWLGSEELAAMAFTFPVIFFYAGISVGIGIGASSIIARKLGASEHREAELLSMDSLVLSVSIATVMMVIGFLTMDSLFETMGAEEDILPLVKDYMSIWYLGVVVVVVPMVGNSIIRATGDTKTPMKIMVASVVVNLVLDPILIFGPGPVPAMGLKGAAWATVVARVVSMLLSVWVLFYQKQLLRFKIHPLRQMVQSWRQVLHVGAPTALVNVLQPVSMGVITALVAAYGSDAVAGFGAATRMESMVLMPIMALCATLVPFVGQNMGAKKLHRVREAAWVGFKLTLFFGIVAFVFLASSGSVSGRLFNDKETVLEAYRWYLVYAGVGWLLLGGSFVAANSFNAMGRPLPATVLTLVRMFVFMVPLAIIGGHFLDVRGIFLGMTVGNILAGLVSMGWLDHVLGKEIRELGLDRVVRRSEPVTRGPQDLITAEAERKP